MHLVPSRARRAFSWPLREDCHCCWRQLNLQRSQTRTRSASTSSILGEHSLGSFLDAISSSSGSLFSAGPSYEPNRCRNAFPLRDTLDRRVNSHPFEWMTSRRNLSILPRWSPGGPVLWLSATTRGCGYPNNRLVLLMVVGAEDHALDQQMPGDCKAFQWGNFRDSAHLRINGYGNRTG